MRKSVNVIKKLLDECSDEDRGGWKSHTRTILSAVHASHPTRRGVKGAIASGFFESSAFPAHAESGWTLTRGRPAEPFTFSMQKDSRSARLLIASLRQESGKLRRNEASRGNEPEYIVQLPRRGSPVKARAGGAGELQHAAVHDAGAGRAWSFDDFDLLAVNLHAASQRWADFIYTLSAWLQPRDDGSGLIAQEQIAPLAGSPRWTSDLALCLDWLATAALQKGL